MSKPASLTEAEVEAILTKLKAADTDKKIDQIQYFGLRLETTDELPDPTLDAITLSIAPLLKSSSPLLITSLLSQFLPTYLPLIPCSSTSAQFRLALLQFLPPLLEKLGEGKERTQASARENVILLGQSCYAAEPGGTPLIGSGKGKEKEGLVGFWERSIKEVLSGRSPRAKVEGMKVLLAMRSSGEGEVLPLKPWLAPLVELLEDGDGSVRDQARETVVALLQPPGTPAAARSELKKLMLTRNVRKTIADGIINRILAPPLSAATPADTPLGEEPPPRVTRSGAATPVFGDEISPVYIAGRGDMEAEFANMLPHFSGKETEHNWAAREKSIIRIRGMLRGQAHVQYRDAFIAGLKSGMMEGISRTILTLRTTLAQQSCAVTQEIAESLGSSFDTFVELILPVLGKMAGLTKKIIAEKSQKSATAIIVHTTCSPRVYVHHIAGGSGDKNVQIRHYSTVHLKTFLDIHGSRSKHAIASGGFVETLETVIKKALGDVNPAVRDLARGAFWSFNNIWPSRANALMSTLDGTVKKQLEKANPRDAPPVQSPPMAPPTRPAPKKASSAMSAMLAEKRKARAAEMAAQQATESSPRIVSGPIPDSPSIGGPKLRSTSSSSIPSRRGATAPLPRAAPVASPGGSPRATTASRFKDQESPRDLLQRSRSSSLNRQASPSPPKASTQPLQQANTFPSGLRSPDGSSATSQTHSLRTPTLVRKPLPVFNQSTPSKSTAAGPPVRGGSGVVPDIVPDAMKAQAAQAESAARQLLDFEEPASNALATPARPTTHLQINGGGPHLLQTPANQLAGRQIWANSPSPGAMTPQMLDNLKGRKTERRWWLARERRMPPLLLYLHSSHEGGMTGLMEVLGQTTPLKNGNAAGPDGIDEISEDLKALQSGNPAIRNLQKLALFSAAHRISPTPEADDSDDEREVRNLWAKGRLFERLFDALLSYLQPSRPPKILMQAMVLLWELIEHQYPLVEDFEAPLIDALFRLRASKNRELLESTNSLISLLTSTSQSPVILLTLLRQGLVGYLEAHPASPSVGADGAAGAVLNGTGTSNGHASAPDSHEGKGDGARNSGYLLGLNGIGMCVLRLPEEVVEVEAMQLEPVIMGALRNSDSDSVEIRQAAHTLILAIQSVLRDSGKTLALFPGLKTAEKDLAMYFFEKHGLLSKSSPGGSGREGEEKREKVMSEMVGLMARGVAAGASDAGVVENGAADVL